MNTTNIDQANTGVNSERKLPRKGKQQKRATGKPRNPQEGYQARERNRQKALGNDPYSYCQLICTPILPKLDVSCPQHVMNVLRINKKGPDTANWAYFQELTTSVSMWALALSPTKKGGMQLVQIRESDGTNDHHHKFVLIYATHTDAGERLPHWVIGYRKSGVRTPVQIPKAHKDVVEFYLKSHDPDGPGGAMSDLKGKGKAPASNPASSPPPTAGASSSGTPGLSPGASSSGTTANAPAVQPPAGPPNNGGIVNAATITAPPGPPAGPPAAAANPPNQPLNNQNTARATLHNIAWVRITVRVNDSVHFTKNSHHNGWCHRSPLPPPVGVPWRPQDHTVQCEQKLRISLKEQRGEVCYCASYPLCRHCHRGLIVFGDHTFREAFVAGNQKLRSLLQGNLLFGLEPTTRLVEERPTSAIAVVLGTQAAYIDHKGKAVDGHYSFHQLNPQIPASYRRLSWRQQALLRPKSSMIVGAGLLVAVIPHITQTVARHFSNPFATMPALRFIDRFIGVLASFYKLYIASAMVQISAADHIGRSIAGEPINTVCKRAPLKALTTVANSRWYLAGAAVLLFLYGIWRYELKPMLTGRKTLITHEMDHGWAQNDVYFSDSILLATGQCDRTRIVQPNCEAEIQELYPDPSTIRVIRKCMITKATDPVTIRHMISMGSSKEQFCTHVNPDAISVAVQQLMKISSQYPGAARPFPPLTGKLENNVNNPCLYCTAGYRYGGRSEKFKNRICPHHREMIYNAKAPSADTPEALLAMEGIPHETGKPIGPLVTVGRDLPLPEMETVPLSKMFKKKAKLYSEKFVDPSLVSEPKSGLLVGYGFAKAPVMTAARGQPIAYKALLARVGRPARNHAQQVAFDKAMMYFNLMFHDVVPVEPMPTKDWISSIRRKKDMEDVIAQMDIEGLPKDFKKPVWKAHIKMEKSCATEWNGTSMVPIKSFKPRLIQAPPDWVHVMLGPYVKTALHMLEKRWGCEDPIFYAGCAKPHQLQHWLERATKCVDHWFVTLDYKMFDCTHSETSFDFAEAVYRKFVEPTEFSDEILKNIRIPAGYTAGPGTDKSNRIKYTAPKEMNGSGRPDTSLVNIVNSVAALTTMCATILSGKEIGDLNITDYQDAMDVCLIAAAGDDSVVVIPKTFHGKPVAVTPQKIDKSIGAFGFDAPEDKATILPDFQGMVFLGHMPYPVGGQWYWGPTLGRRCYKHHTMLNPHGDVRAWLHGVAKMEALCYPHVPILSDLANKTLAQLKGHKINVYSPSDIAYKAAFSGPGFTPPKYDASTVSYVESFYHLTPGSIADFISGLPPLPALLNHPVIDALLAIDEL